MKICVDVRTREVSEMLQKVGFRNGFYWLGKNKNLTTNNVFRLFFTNDSNYGGYPIIEYASDAYESDGYILCGIEETIEMLNVSQKVLFKGVEFSRSDFEELQRKFEV